MGKNISAVAIRYNSRMSTKPVTTPVSTTELHQYNTSSEAARALAESIKNTPYCFPEDVIEWDELHVAFDLNTPTVLKRLAK